MVWADLASGPQSRCNAENGFCNHGLFGPETAISFFSTKIMNCLAFLMENFHFQSGIKPIFFLKCGELRIHAMVWADLASGPQSRRIAESGSCNRGLFGSETAIFFLFNQTYAQLCIFDG